MRRIEHSAGAGCAATRIVCLPGAYHSAQDFETAGFGERVRRRRLPIDLAFVDVEMQHLGDRRPLTELRDTVVLPARAAGCRTLWLAGISLGGLIALDYSARHPGDVDGVCLLAPYLGNRMLTGEIARTGLSAWKAGELAESDEERRIWSFVQALATGSGGSTGSGRSGPRLHLGYGRDDRFAAAHGLLAAALPRQAVNVVPGGHDWRTWTILWENFLDSSRFD